MTIYLDDLIAQLSAARETIESLRIELRDQETLYQAEIARLKYDCGALGEILHQTEQKLAGGPAPQEPTE